MEQETAQTPAIRDSFQNYQLCRATAARLGANANMVMNHNVDYFDEEKEQEISIEDYNTDNHDGEGVDDVASEGQQQIPSSSPIVHQFSVEVILGE